MGAKPNILEELLGRLAVDPEAGAWSEWASLLRERGESARGESREDVPAERVDVSRTPVAPGRQAGD